jgi:hypothetical protein
MAKIPWSRIREAFAGEWVELVDYAWRPDALHPRAGAVRHHSTNRAELLQAIQRSGQVRGSVVLFVGASVPSLFPSAYPSFYTQNA